MPVNRKLAVPGGRSVRSAGIRARRGDLGAWQGRLADQVDRHAVVVSLQMVATKRVCRLAGQDSPANG
jgi:hypothetical protein